MPRVVGVGDVGWGAVREEEGWERDGERDEEAEAKEAEVEETSTHRFRHFSSISRAAQRTRKRCRTRRKSQTRAARPFSTSILY